MTRYLAAYGACMVVMLVLDVVWIGLIAKPIYRQGIGHLMAAQFNGLAVAAFYLVYGVGLMFFVVAPDGASTAWGRTLLAGALFGLVAYATYDLTNLATLKDWPLRLALMDIAWGGIASVSAAAAGKWAFDRMAVGA